MILEQSRAKISLYSEEPKRVLTDRHFDKDISDGHTTAGYEMIHINDLKNCSCALVFFGSCPKIPIAESERKTKLK